MKFLNNSPTSLTVTSAASSKDFERTGDAARIAHHFLNDPKAKFILSDIGDLLYKNMSAMDLLSKGALSYRSDGKLNYGSSELTTAANKILKQIRLGRAAKLKLLKKFEDDWIIFEFSSPEFNANKEVLLTVQKRGDCLEYSLDAVSRIFDFSLTETEVVRHMSLAYCPKEISGEMNISINTVRAHLRSIYAKIGTRGYNRSLRVIMQLIH